MQKYEKKILYAAPTPKKKQTPTKKHGATR